MVGANPSVRPVYDLGRHAGLPLIGRLTRRAKISSYIITILRTISVNLSCTHFGETGIHDIAAMTIT